MKAGMAIWWLLLTLSLVNAHEWSPCPSRCHCSESNAAISVKCSSLHFLRKLHPEHSAALKSLNISNTSRHGIDKSFRRFANLEHLDLSHNDITDLRHVIHLPKLKSLNLGYNLIKSFSAKYLPKSLISLDVSHNKIRELPQDLLKLHHLRQITITANPLTCTQSSLDVRDGLIDRKITIIVGNTMCHEPHKFRGEKWLHAIDMDEFMKLSNDEEMLRDQPEGSGEGEGSGDDFAVPDHSSADFFTERPIEITTMRSSSNDFQFDDITTEEHDISKFQQGSGDSVHEIPTTYIPEKEYDNELGSGTSEIWSVAPFPDKNENIVSVRKNDLNTERKSSNTDINEIYALDERKIDKSQSLGTNIFLGVFLFCLIALLIYAIKVRKTRRKSQNKKGDAEKCAADEGSPESIPLVSHQNGNTAKINEKEVPEKELESNESNNVKKSPIQLRKNIGDDVVPDENTEEKNDGRTNGVNSSAATGSPSPPVEDVRSVTVKSSELPDSTLQTPLLVTRSSSPDGKTVVIMPNLDQRPGQRAAD